jgi:hypothetical protein
MIFCPHRHRLSDGYHDGLQSDRDEDSAAAMADLASRTHSRRDKLARLPGAPWRVPAHRRVEVPRSAAECRRTQSFAQATTLPYKNTIGGSGEFDVFTQQVGESLPLLEEMGYEVSTFRVQWGLPPKAKLRLRAKGTTDPDKIKAIEAKAPGGMMMRMLLSSAAAAKRIQSSMKFGTAIIDVDFAVPPKIKMSFL